MSSCSALQPHTQVQRRRMRKSAWYTLCLVMHLITTKFHGNHVRTCMCTGDVINSPCWCASWHSVQVSSISHCSMPSGGWLPQEKAQKELIASTECISQGSIPLCTLVNSYHCLPDIFLCIWQYKLGTACSTDVYSIQRTKAEVNFMMVYVIYGIVDHHSCIQL